MIVAPMKMLLDRRHFTLDRGVRRNAVDRVALRPVDLMLMGLARLGVLRRLFLLRGFDFIKIMTFRVLMKPMKQVKCQRMSVVAYTVLCIAA
ncbi:MAG TPA: hypothetical protein DDY14_07270 [Chromatiaceae bacterium]|nr:hypothetical protein [Chromatiaceae bacterium]